MNPTSWFAAPSRRNWALWGVPVVVRAGFVVLLFGATGLGWREYLGLSDGGSFLAVAHAIQHPAQAAHLKFYDTRVFPFWPLIEAPVLALGLPDPAVLALTVILAGLAVWLFDRLTGNLALALLLGVFPPAWVLATVHPVSEALYLVLGLTAAAGLRAGRFSTAGGCAGAMIATRPFGVAWAGAAVVLAAAESRRRRSWQPVARMIPGLLLGLAPLVVVNLALYGDLWHQVRVYAAPLDALNVHGAAAAAVGNASGHWGPPFWYVLSTPWVVPVPRWKVIYIYAHVAALLVLAPVAVAGIRAELRGRRDLARVFLLGAFLLNSALIVCTGPYWGFHSFDRYFIWGLPGALLCLELLLRGRNLPWLPLAGAASLATAAFAILRHLS